MSISIMRCVWNASSLGGTELLLLLAIADFANDDGIAFPSVTTLANKIRMSKRNTNYLLNKIMQSGELQIERNAGPKGCNLFRVQTLQSAKSSPVQPIALGDAMDGSKGVQPTAPEPSVNHQEPSDDVLSAKSDLDLLGDEPASRIPKCPIEAIVDAYHRSMPSNPRVKVINNFRRKAISARWREAATLTCKPFGYRTEPEGIEAWRRFFSVCAVSKFLTGRAQPQVGKPPFLADIDFLMSPSGFASCLENKYHRDAA